MSEENKAIYRRYLEEVVSKGNLAVVDEIIASNVVAHEPPDQEIKGSEALKQWLTQLRTAFPDEQITVVDQIAEGDKVATRYTERGTHKGEFMGIPATGKQATVTGIEIARIVGGKIVEYCVEGDMLGRMQQLGVVSPPQ